MVEYVALQCAGCDAFQVQQEKRAKKWRCTICGANQTLQRVHARGPAASLRPIVQDLNMRRGETANRSPEATPEVSFLTTDKEEMPAGGWGAYMSDKSEEEEEPILSTPKKMPAAKPKRRERASYASGPSRKRGFDASDLDNAAAQSGHTQWKRMRTTPRTPQHSPRCRYDDTTELQPQEAYGTETTTGSLFPKWKVGGVGAEGGGGGGGGGANPPNVQEVFNMDPSSRLAGLQSSMGVMGLEGVEEGVGGGGGGGGGGASCWDAFI